MLTFGNLRFLFATFCSSVLEPHLAEKITAHYLSMRINTDASLVKAVWVKRSL